MYSKYESALNICHRELAADELRVGIEPKLIHSILVARVLEKYTKNEDLLAVALLHEIPMDRLKKLVNYDKKLFNKDVRRYLYYMNKGLTDDSNWWERSVRQLQEIAKAPWQVVMIKTAIYIRNLNFLLDNFKYSSEVFEKRFGYSPKNVATVYSHFYFIASTHASIPKPMIDELLMLIDKFKDRFTDSR